MTTKTKNKSQVEREFVFGELWGRFPCEVKDCSQWADTIVLTGEENVLLPYQSGSEAASFIFKEKLGISKCENCLRKKK